MTELMLRRAPACLYYK